MDDSTSLEALADILTQISENPYDISLHVKHIQLASASGMEDQVIAARQMLTTYWPAGDEVWLPTLESRIQKGVDTLEDTLEVLALFHTAEEDYLSIPVLQKHIEFLIDRHLHFNSAESRPEGMEDVVTREWTRAMIKSVVGKGVGHLTQGHVLWNAHFDWEMEQLDDASLQGEERTNLILGIEDMLLDRLKQPHSTNDETFQTYSTFTTNHKSPNIYEKLMVTATKVKAPAVKSYERRERNELMLAQLNYSPEAYDSYLTYERRAKYIDLPVFSMLYERAISDTAKRRHEGSGNAEAALRTFWAGYCDILRTNSAELDRQRSILQRALRSVPGCGGIWARYFRFLENTESDANVLMESASETYNKALSTGLIQKDIEEIVPLVLARAGLIKRVIMSDTEVEGGAETLFKVLEDAIAMTRSVSQQGDPRYRLEKYTADLYSNLAASPDLASTIWQATTEHFKYSYLAWTNYLESLTKQEKHDEVRAIFADIVHKNLDWPEAIFDAWVTFEHLHGTADEINDSMDMVAKAQAKVNTKRAKDAEKAARLATQASSHMDAATALISEATQQTSSDAQTFTAVEASAMDVDEVHIDGVRKRKSEEDGGMPDKNKKAKTENSAPLKRDRENSTVFVSDLPTTVSKDDLNGLFKDCGAIREIKVTDVANSKVATVEFMERDSVPGGLTKDKKRLGGHEISVHLAWQSTLYVTNFPEKADDVHIRELFGKFGVIFDVRWPSKKYKATRRFCYIQYASPSSAQAALSMHEKEMEPGLSMNVLISNPERKKARTDAGANDREVYITGLSKFANKDDLEKLFKTYGTVKEVRMIKDTEGLSKGVAFVEYEDEASAQRALQANNHELKNRRIAVTLSDSRIRAKNKIEQTASGLNRLDDVRSRSVRIKGLPSATQEGLLQQALEKIVPVKRLEVFQEYSEATAELCNASDVGKLVLLKEPLIFAGVNLTISEELLEGSSKHQSGPPPKTGGSMFIPRNAASRPRAGLGSSKKPTQKAKADTQGVTPVPGVSSSSISGSTKSQDDFRKLLK